ncbi:unnamed protein product, partial [marine sediment metagenome]
EEKLNRAVSILSKEGITVYGCSFDVIDKKQIHQKISALEKKFSPIDILVNNAGIQRRAKEVRTFPVHLAKAMDYVIHISKRLLLLYLQLALQLLLNISLLLFSL